MILRNSLNTLLITSICIVPAVHASGNADELFFEMPVVLSASRLEQPASETPIAVSTIDRQMIEASGARTIPDVLRLVPGIIVGHSANEFGDEPKIVVAYHGHTDQFSRQMQVLIDGRSVYEPMAGGVAWNMLPINLEDIERIEVSRGPNTASYGSNSFLAVINIITRQAIEDQGHLVKTVVGNHDIVDLTYRFGDSVGELDYRFTLATQNDDGQNRADGLENRDDVSANAFDYRMDYQIDSRSQFTYQGGYSRTDIETDKNYAPTGIKPQRDVENINTYQFIKYENNFNDKNSFVLQYYYNLLDKNDASISNEVPPFPLSIFGLGPGFSDPFTLDLDFSIKSQRHNLEFTYYSQATDKLRLISGLSAQLDLGQSNYLLGTSDTLRRELYRAFTNIEWHVSKKDILNFGLNVEKNVTLGTEASPRLSYIHKFNTRHSLRAGVSTATRSPFITEEHGNISLMHELTVGGVPTGFTLVDQQQIPAPDLLNENIISRDIGYYGRFLNDDLLINIRAFRDTTSDLVRLEKVSAANDNIPGDGETDIFINYNSTVISGIEIEVDAYPDKTLRIIASASYLDIASNDPVPDGRTEDYINSAPRKTASILAIKQFNEKYSGSTGFYYVGNFSWIDAHSPGPNQYRKLDMRVSRHMRFNADKGTLSLVLKNLLDEYTDYDRYPDNGPLLEQDLTAYLEFKLLFR